MTMPLHLPPVPKYWQLFDRFREQIESGALQPGDSLPSLTEMRTSYGASRPTVEKAYAMLQEQGLIDCKPGSIRLVAGKVRVTTKGVLGLSGPGFSFKGSSLYWTNVMEGICEAAEKAGSQIMLLGHQSNRGWEKVDGLLISDWQEVWATRHLPPELPRVSVLAPLDGMASVVADDYQGAALATQYLLDRGHRTISYLHTPADHSVVQRRLAGYQDTLRAAGIVDTADLRSILYGEFMEGLAIVACGHQVMKRWLQEGWSALRSTAILCHNDEVALGVIQALQEAGVRVPEDVSVIGYDGTALCDLARPQLTSIEVPLRAIGSMAVEALLSQIEADTVNTNHRTVPVHIRAGQTVRSLPGFPI